MTVTGTSVRARGLRKVYRPSRYREVAALNGLDLGIGAGEIVALLGVSVLGADLAAAGRDWRGLIDAVGLAGQAGPRLPGCRRPGIRQASPGRISRERKRDYLHIRWLK